jgi:hypothetical protein
MGISHGHHLAAVKTIEQLGVDDGTPRQLCRARVVALDVLKLVAITAVVFNHTCTEEVFHAGMQLTRFGNHAFTAVSCYLAFAAGDRSVAGERGGWMLRRVTALYGLFLIWNSVGLLARLAGAAHAGQANPFTLDGMLLSGFTLGLWFLPFIGIANCLAYVVGGHLRGSRTGRRLGVWGGVLGAIALALAMSPGYTQVTFPVYFFTIALKNIPTTLLTIALAIFLVRRPELPSRPAVRASAIAGFLLGAAAVISFDRNIFLWECLMGIALLVGFMGWRMDRIGRPPALLSIFIFVAHGIFIQVLRHLVMPAKTAANAESYWLFNLLLFGLTLGGLLALYQLVMRLRLGMLLLAPQTAADPTL